MSDKVVGPRKISLFLENLGLPQIVSHDLETSYAIMAPDIAREKESPEWTEGLVTGFISSGGLK